MMRDEPDLSFSEEQRAIADAVRRFCDQRDVDAQARASGAPFPRELWQALAELGIFAPAAPGHTDAGGALEEIENVSEQLAELINTISVSASQQAKTAAEMSSTMNGIQDVTTQTATGSEQTSRSIGNLARMAKDLDQSVAGFKLP